MLAEIGRWALFVFIAFVALLMILDEGIGSHMTSVFFDDLTHAQEITLNGMRRAHHP